MPTCTPTLSRLAGFLLVGAIAAPLTSAAEFTLVTQTVLEYGTGIGPATTVIFPGAKTRLRANSEVFPVGSSWTGWVSAATRHDPPSAISDSVSNSRGIVQGAIILGGGYPSFARATLEYDYIVEETRPAPAMLPQGLTLPLSVDAMLYVFASKQGEAPFNEASARAYAVIGGYNSPRLVAHAPDNSFASDEYRFTLATSVEPGQVVEVVLFTEARSRASAGPHGFTTVVSEAKAIADPVVSFDQGAFDLLAQLYGFETFALNEYFAIRYSPGIGPDAVAEVPEAGSMALVFLGLGSVAIASRRFC